MRVAALVLCASIGALDVVEAHGQNYPVRPVRIMVGYPPGGGVDVGARIVAQGLSEVWGTTNAIVDNRPGGTGSIATDITVSAAPDGYTTMLCQIASHAITPARKKLTYDH